MNENENTTTQDLWNTVKAVLRGRFIAIQAYFKKQEKSQINNLTLHLKQLEKEEMKNPRVSRRKEILKIRGEINAKGTKETLAKINKAKSWFFEKINKTGKPLARHIKKQREKNQINKIRNKNGEITTDNSILQRRELKTERKQGEERMEYAKDDSSLLSSFFPVFCETFYALPHLFLIKFLAMYNNYPRIFFKVLMPFLFTFLSSK